MTTRKITLTIVGHIPSKKNEYKYSKRGVYIEEETRSYIEVIERQLRKQWGMRLPALHPKIDFRMKVSNDERDTDNAWTTIQDCLVKVGILADDNIKKNNGKKVLHEAVVDRSMEQDEETATIEMSWKEWHGEEKSAEREAA